MRWQLVWPEHEADCRRFWRRHLHFYAHATPSLDAGSTASCCYSIVALHTVSGTHKVAGGGHAVVQ